MEITHESIYLDKWSFVQDKPTTFIRIFLFDEAFEYGNGAKFLG
jgi:hypothetical protein